ncbi:MAG: malonyl-[acyl-carrier protein] O-methyltransferase BioC, partial [Mariprofundaceae bacterium]
MPGNHISCSKVRQAFGRSAASYDGHAILQREVADRLLAHMDFTKFRPKTILDIGSGTGYFTQLLHRRFRRS